MLERGEDERETMDRGCEMVRLGESEGSEWLGENG